MSEAVRLVSHDATLDAEGWSDAIDEVRHLHGEQLAFERATSASQRRGSRPQIDREVTRPIAPIKSAVIERARRAGTWPPDSDLLAVLLVSLLADLEDPSEWLTDVHRALAVVRTAIADYRRLVQRHRDAKEQLDAGSRALKEQLIHRFVRARRGERLEDAADPFDRRDAEMDRVARRQQQLAIAAREDGPRRRGPRPRTPPPLRSVADGWRWHDGRPDEHGAPVFLLRVEIWRDVRADLRPADGDHGRISRRQALAEVFAADLRRCDPVAYRRLEGNRRSYEAKGYSRVEALTLALVPPRSPSPGDLPVAGTGQERVLGPHERQFQNLYARCSQLLKGR